MPDAPDDLAARYRLERALSLIAEELARVSDVPKLLRQALAASAELLAADHGVIAFVPHVEAPIVRAATWERRVARGRSDAAAGAALPAAALADAVLLRAFIAQRRPSVPPTVILAPLTTDGRTIGVMGLARATPFERGAGRFLGRVTRLMSREIAHREEQRLVTVLERITAKIVQELRPNDLFYQILHGLRDLLRYDHSSALFLFDAETQGLRLRAEQIAYAKAKSAEIGRVVATNAAIREQLAQDGVHVVARPSVVWEGAEPWRTLAPHLAGASGPPERALLLAPLVYRGTALGLLKVTAVSAHAFGEREAHRLARLAPFAAAALAHAQATLRFEAQLIETEKRAAMTDLARGVAHDVNNALGVILPLAEQLRADAEDGAVEVSRAGEDAAEIARSARLAKRVMSGMMHLARGGAARRTRVDLAAVAQSVAVVLGSRLEARRLTLAREIDPTAAAVYADQGQIERIVLNLLLNALDASPEGGRITVRTAPVPATNGNPPRVVLSVEDEGPGIPPEILAQVEEPFFTTKPGGTGLGLAICRALAWENDGRLAIESAPGRGTRARVTLLAAAAAPVPAPQRRPDPESAAPASTPTPATPTHGA